MSFIPSLISTQGAGTASTGATFWKDLQDVGLWPSEQLITKITKIVIYYNTDRITGIDTTYLLEDSTTQSIMRGSALDDDGQLELTDSELIAGSFGAVNVSDGGLRRIGFVVYDTANGQMSTKGPFPSVSETVGGVEGFAFLGQIRGFGGYTSTDNLLDSILFFETVASEAGNVSSG